MGADRVMKVNITESLYIMDALRLCTHRAVGWVGVASVGRILLCNLFTIKDILLLMRVGRILICVYNTHKDSLLLSSSCAIKPIELSS